MSDREDRSWHALGALCTIACFIVEPFVMVALWRWFVVPLSVPPLTWSVACGLNLVVTVFMFRYPGERDAETQAKASAASLSVAITAFCIGWLVVRLAS